MTNEIGETKDWFVPRLVSRRAGNGSLSKVESALRAAGLDRAFVETASVFKVDSVDDSQKERLQGLVDVRRAQPGGSRRRAARQNPCW